MGTAPDSRIAARLALVAEGARIRGEVRLRVYERGAGETASCGTGACAAVAIGRRRGLLGEEVRVLVRGGELRVNWKGPGEPIWLTGPAEVSFEGHVEVQTL